MFHVKDDWSFRRLNHGDVRAIYRNPKPPNDVLEFTFTAREWCAIVASVSRVGETDESYTDAKFVHMGRLPFGAFPVEHREDKIVKVEPPAEKSTPQSAK